MSQTPSGPGLGYDLYAVTVAPGYYSVETLANALQTALRQRLPNATVAWQESSKSYAFRYSADGASDRLGRRG